MKKIYFSFLLAFCALSSSLMAQSKLDALLPIRGFAIAAPRPSGMEPFLKFINEELGPKKINTLILRVDWNYQYQKHPELSDSGALSKADVKRLVAAARKFNIRIIPQVNLLGHQSWADHVGKLLLAYPQFDETPWLKIVPGNKYPWPNPEGYYCKSYCPLAPGLHEVVFDLIDEITDAFETNAFHAGMDEVFYIGHDKCPRCSGRDKAELFAGEVTALRNHLAASGKELWIWGDRMIDGKATGIGEWAASMNNTHRAIDLVPKDIVVNDWQYGRANQTAVLFAMKGIRVVSCPWDRPMVATTQVDDMIHSREVATKEVKGNFYGVMHTVWSGPAPFLDGYYKNSPAPPPANPNPNYNAGNTPWNTFKIMYDKINKLDPGN